MTPAHAAKGVRRYRYYTCTRAQRHGWDACPSKSLPADAIERLVLERIRGVGRDQSLLTALLAPARDGNDVSVLGEEQAIQTLGSFDALWPTWTTDEQARMLGVLVERVDYDGAQGKLNITFHPRGLEALAEELACRAQEAIS